LPTTQEITAIKDSIPRTALLDVASAVNDSVTGVLYAIGNDPFIKLGLQTPDGTMYILKCTKEIESDLLTKQGKIVTIYYNGIEQIPEGQALKIVSVEYLH
jgi:hypothetical protein